MPLDLDGQTAIVTGAGRGIGEEIANTFAAHGANVVAAARTESEIEATVEAAKEQGVDAIAVPTDLAKVSDIDNLMDETVDEFGTPEILVNNAGLNIVGPPLDHTVEEVDQMLDVNLRGLFLLSQRFGQQFRNSPREHGRIINISSVSATIGVSAMTLYGGTNAGIYGITRGMAAELGQDGVTVNSVTPGITLVERIKRIIDEKGDDLYNLDRLPLDRFGYPEDIANACLFLASDMAGYIHGTDILVDGGVSFTAGFLPSDL